MTSIPMPTSSHSSHRVATGVAYGAGAGALWGLVFLAPELAEEFSPLELSAGRYFFYGLIAAALIAPRWQHLRTLLSRSHWMQLFWLALAGNTIYYVLLSAAVQLGGIAMTSLVIGFLPVVVTVIGSRDQGAVPLRSLWLSLLLCAFGAVCIGWQALATPTAQASSWLGLACAIGALITWTAFAVGNARCLQKLESISAYEWNLLTGIVTGAQSLLLIALALVVHEKAHQPAAWAGFAVLSMVVAVVASVVGNAFWNRMSRLLPLTLVGQMILFETVFALIYGLLWEQRLPTLLEMVALGCVIMAVLSCVAVHRRPAAVAAVGA